MPRKLRAFTIVEVMIGLTLFLVILFASYRLFFSEVRSIRHALEHIGVNENARLFTARFGNDVRNANWLDFPAPSVREGVPMLLPAAEGKFCAMTQQVFDFTIKPPDPRFIKNVKIEYRLKKTSGNSFEIYRDVVSEVPTQPGGPTPVKFSRRVCEGIKEIFVYSSIRRPAKLTSFPGLPFKNLLVYEPYDIDGTGPYLVHVRATFIRSNLELKQSINAANALVLKTCFAIRGRLNWVNP